MNYNRYFPSAKTATQIITAYKVMHLSDDGTFSSAFAEGREVFPKSKTITHRTGGYFAAYTSIPALLQEQIDKGLVVVEVFIPSGASYTRFDGANTIWTNMFVHHGDCVELDTAPQSSISELLTKFANAEATPEDCKALCDFGIITEAAMTAYIDEATAGSANDSFGPFGSVGGPVESPLSSDDVEPTLTPDQVHRPKALQVEARTERIVRRTHPISEVMPTGNNSIHASVCLDELDTVADVIFAVNQANGWHDKEREFGTYVALFHSELSEALEAERKGNRCTYIAADFEALEAKHGEAYKTEYEEYVKDTVEAELAGTVIRILDYCAANDIDLGAYIKAEVNYNALRGKRHGGKRF